MSIFREEVINIELARILNRFGLKAAPETIKLRKFPDVLIVINGVKINIEGRFTTNPLSNKLETDCIKKLEEGIADIAVAIFYPGELRTADTLEQLSEKIEQSFFDFSIVYLSSEGIKTYRIQKANIKRLIENINNTYNIVLKSDVLTNKIKEIELAIKYCSDIAIENNLFFNSDKLISELRAILGINNNRKTTSVEKRQLIEISLFILFDALVFHEALSTSVTSINSFKKKSDKESYLEFILDEWKKILQIDYLPIFLIAKSILASLPSSVVTEDILEKLSNQSLSVLSSGVLLKHDLMGRIYHKLLLKTTGEFYATYYTSIPAAWILANLSLKTPDHYEFNSLEKIKKLSILDPACGSGTLLSASYNAIKDRYIETSENYDLDKLHKILIENVIHGWDVLDYAGHLSLITLALHNYKAFFQRSNIYILPVGIDKNGLHLGSLDYINENQLRFRGKDFFSEPIQKGLIEDVKKDISEKVTNYDLIIMNPPFSRSAGLINTKFGYEDKKIQEKLNKRLSELGKRLGLTGIGQAGLGAYFIILGDRLLKDCGKLAIVIPRAILSGVSWSPIRNILMGNYEIEYIVNNHDPGDKQSKIDPWSFSENTSLSEVLIVARKIKKPLKDKTTTIINLWNKPKNEIESLIIASSAIKYREENEELFNENEKYKEVCYSDKTVGTIYNISQEYLNYNFLFPALFANPHLNRLTFNLLFGDIVQTEEIGNLSSSLGVDRKQISSNFKITDVPTPYSILWGHPNSLTSIRIEKEHLKYVNPIQSTSVKLYKFAKRLLISEHLFLNNNSVVALYSEEPILSTAFWEVDFEKDLSQIISLWLNSTIGFILLISNSISSYGPQINIKKEQLKKIKVINPSILSDKLKKDFLEFFDRIKDKKFAKFPDEFRLAYEGKGLRKIIDDFLIEKLSLKLNLKEYYKLLSEEPIISKKRL